MIRAICDAASEGKVDTVKKLLRADPLLAAARDEEGWTACLRAAFFDQDGSAAVLLRAGAPPNDVDLDSYGFGVLHWAAERNNVNMIISVAATKGADMNLKDRCGYTPLHRAALWGNLSAVMALVVAGADPRMETDKGETPEFLADEFPAIRCFLKASRHILWACRRPDPNTKHFAGKAALRSPLSSGTVSSCVSDEEEEDESGGPLSPSSDEELSSYQRLISPGSSHMGGKHGRSVASMFVNGSARAVSLRPPAMELPKKAARAKRPPARPAMV